MRLVANRLFILAADEILAADPVRRLRRAVIIPRVPLRFQRQQIREIQHLRAADARRLRHRAPAHPPPHPPIRRNPQQDFIRRQAALRQRAHRPRAGLPGIVIRIQRRVMPRLAVKAAQVVRHHYHLIRQRVQPRRVNRLQQAIPRPDGDGQRVFLPGLGGSLVKPVAQEGQQRVPVFYILRAALDAPRRRAGVLPVNIHAAEAVFVHQSEDAVRQPRASIHRRAGVGEALRAPAADRHHPADVRVLAQIRANAVNRRPMAADRLAVPNEGEGVVDLVDVRRVRVAEGQIRAVERIHNGHRGIFRPRRRDKDACRDDGGGQHRQHHPAEPPPLRLFRARHLLAHRGSLPFAPP